MSNRPKIALIDLDPMLHTVANVQISAGNRGNAETTKEHIRSFINTIEKNSGCQYSIKFFQGKDHKNYRNDILPEYKGHREPSEAMMVWKESILEEFETQGAVELKFIESDDAQSILAGILGKDYLIVSSDKDMKQVPGNHYNPYKRNLTAEQRFFSMTIAEAAKFFWAQVLAGDATDMPNSMCGIEGIGMGKDKPGKAFKLLDSHPPETPYQKIIQKEYTKKYGSKEGFIRASRTYKMVRLLGKFGNDYINEDAAMETKRLIIEDPKDLWLPIEDSIVDLFTAPTPTNLFKK